MKKDDPLWSDVNNLLSFLRSAGCLSIVDQHFAKLNNDAPGLILKRYISKLQKHLDEAENARTDKTKD